MKARDVLTNPYFCPMPWSGIMYNFDGKVKNCIRSNENMPIGDIKDDTIDEIILGKENISRQQNILSSTPVASCDSCYRLEKNKKTFDIISDRVFYLRELKNTPLDVYTEGNFNLQAVDVRWSNLCNFACVYCNAEFSSRWAKETNVSFNLPTASQQEEFKNFIFSQASNLKHVYLAGGEPLLMKENLELLDRLDPDVNLRINTNLSKTETRVFEKVCQFKNVHWTVSAESMSDEYEYIRFGGNWENFLKNLLEIKSLGHKISFNMLWLILNFESIFDFVDFMVKLGFHNNSFIIGAMDEPAELNIRHLPLDMLKSIKKKLEDRINEHPGYLLENSYRNMLDYIDTPFNKRLESSFLFLKNLDIRRNIDSSKIFKELYTLKDR